MRVPKDIAVPGSQRIGSYPAAAVIAFGAAVVGSGVTQGAETLKPALAEYRVLGLAGMRKFLPRGGYDGFWAVYENVDLIADYGMALVIPNGGDYNIDFMDYLELADLGDGSSNTHGIMEEAGSHAGGTLTSNTVARALKGVTMGSKSYKVPASDVAVGDTQITMTAGHISTMGLEVGDYILLEDITAELQVNKVASLTSTVIGLVMPSTVSLVHNDSDLVTRLYQCPVMIMK